MVKDTYYESLINQIAKDYDCDVEKAESIFEKSGILTPVLEAIESDTDSYNKSQGNATEKIGSTQKTLGNSTHWYDEKVKVVIRRFVTDPVYLKDIAATDKLDYGTEPTGRNDVNKGTFEFTLYLNKNIFDSSELFNLVDV